MTGQIRTPAEQHARRTIRVITRHLGHISKDAPPHVLAQLHAELGRAITLLAGSVGNE